MLSRRRRQGTTPGDAGPSPWSSEANAPGAPPLIWESPPSAGNAPPGDALDDPPDHDGPPGAPRPVWAGAAIAAVVALGGLVWLWPGGSGDGDGRAAIGDEAAAEAAPTTLGTLPPPTAPDDDLPDDSPDDGAEDEGSGNVGSAGGDAGAGSPDDEGPVVRDSVPSTRTVELPPGLPEFASPFEVVMATADGIATLSFPSGTLRTTPIDFVDGFARVVDISVAPDATFVAGFGEAVIVDRDGSTITDVDLGPYGGGIGVAGWGPIDGGTGFTLYGWNESGLPNLVTVDRSGAIADVGVAPVYPAYPTPDGAQLLGDAGGVFRVERDGSAARIAQGSLLGYGFGRMLLRECDDRYRCGLATVEVGTGDRIDFADVAEADLPAQLQWSNGASLSPDGTKVAVTLPAGSGVRDVVLHADGTSYGAASTGESFFGRGLSWTPDSAGFFRTSPPASLGSPGGGTVRFVSATGEVVVIGSLPEDVTSLGVRAVDEELAVVDGDRLGVPVPPATGLTLVGVDRGTAVHIDLDRGDLSTWSTPDVGGDPDLFVVDDQLVAVSADGRTAFRSGWGAVAEERTGWTLTLPGPRFEGPDDRLMWRAGEDGSSYELVPVPFSDRGGRAPWRTVDVTGEDVLGTDGSGGLVYQAGGDVFVSTNTGTERVTSGRLIALGGGRILVLECDASGICRNRLVELDGSRSDVAGAPGAALPLEAPASLEGTVSPDGGVVYVRLNPLLGRADGDSDWAFVELSTDAVTPAPELDRGTEIVWNDAGTAAVFLTESLMQIYDRATGTVVAVPTAGTFDDIVAVPDVFPSLSGR